MRVNRLRENVVFSSIVFLFFFLPIALIIGLGLQAVANRKGGVGWALTAGNAWLLVISFLFYAWGEPILVWVLVLSCGLNYAGGLVIAAAGRWRSWVLSGFVTANLGLLAWFKYSGLLVDLANRINAAVAGVFGSEIAWTGVALPLGISFYTFHGISYLVDVARGTVAPTTNLLTFGSYNVLFPQLVAGPIVRYAEVGHSFRRRTVGLDDLAAGATRFIAGLGKKTLIANPVSQLADAAFALGAGDLTAAAAWLGVVAYAIQIYFDFSGYSDMAIGIGRMLGFRFPENFNHPYAAVSMRDFWRRWHMTLSRFFRDYLYLPLGGNRRGPWRTSFNLLLVFALCGLWHGASWTFMLWGLFHGVFLAAERVLEPVTDGARAWLRPLRHVYVGVVVLLSWVLFRADTAAAALAYYRAMSDMETLTTIAVLPWRALSPDVMLALAAGLVLSVPWTGVLRPRLETRAGWRVAAEAIGSVALLGVLVLSLLSIGASSHNPFIYFRF